MTLLVRDEVDIVRNNLDYHLARGVDHIVATDHASEDGTTEILEEYARSGVLTLLREPSVDYAQGPWVNRMARMARDHFGAKWILNNDADEFWRPPPGQDLKTVVQGIRSAQLTCRRVHMIGPHEALGRQPWYDALVWHRRNPPKLREPRRGRLRMPYFYHSLPHKVLVKAEGLVQVSKGAHSATFNSKVETELCDIVIHHFPIRSRAAFARSVQRIGNSVKRDRTLASNVSWKYRRWLRMLEEDGSIDRALEEALPSARRLLVDRVAGKMKKDLTLSRELVDLSASSVAQVG